MYAEFYSLKLNTGYCFKVTKVRMCGSTIQLCLPGEYDPFFVVMDKIMDYWMCDKFWSDFGVAEAPYFQEISMEEARKWLMQ